MFTSVKAIKHRHVTGAGDSTCPVLTGIVDGW